MRAFLECFSQSHQMDQKSTISVNSDLCHDLCPACNRFAFCLKDPPGVTECEPVMSWTRVPDTTNLIVVLIPTWMSYMGTSTWRHSTTRVDLCVNSYDSFAGLNSFSKSIREKCSGTCSVSSMDASIPYRQMSIFFPLVSLCTVDIWVSSVPISTGNIASATNHRNEC